MPRHPSVQCRQTRKQNTNTRKHPPPGLRHAPITRDDSHATPMSVRCLQSHRESGKRGFCRRSPRNRRCLATGRISARTCRGCASCALYVPTVSCFPPPPTCPTTSDLNLPTHRRSISRCRVDGVMLGFGRVEMDLSCGGVVLYAVHAGVFACRLKLNCSARTISW